MQTIRSDNLRKAKFIKNDEFYTLYEDIEKEIPHYAEFLKGKHIYCNCDNPYRSNFVKYFQEHFQELGLKRLTATCFAERKTYIQHTFFDEEEEFSSDGNEGAYRLEMSEDSCKISELNGNGNFQSEECKSILKQADIIITNPPFSKIIDFMTLLDRYQKKFLIIANQNAIASKEIFRLFQYGKIHFGFHHVKDFLTPDGTIQKFGNICWFTNLPARKKQNLILTEHFHEGKYLRYENYDAIHVEAIKDIPCDYNGKMAVPLTYLNYFDAEQFELVGIAHKDFVDIAPVPEQFLHEFFEQGGHGHYTSTMRVLCMYDRNHKPVFPYCRMIIRKKGISA